MKHLDDALWFAELLRETGIELDTDSQHVLLSYLNSVIEANQTLNLTRITGARDAIRLHLVDSLIALPEVESAPPGSLLDIGTGGGFPGVPLCVASGRRGVLLDSVRKKATTVQGLLESAGLAEEIATQSMRAEELAAGGSAKFAVVTARAVSVLPSLVELAAPLLVPGGRLVALKGSPESEEMSRGRAAAKICGMVEQSVRKVSLPEGHEGRTVVSYEKVGRSSVRLPRRTGLAQKSPLA